MTSESKFLSITNNNAIIDANSKKEIAIIRAFYTDPGDYKTYIEIQIEKERFYIPVKIKVIVSGLELPSKINFGILTVKGFAYPFEITGKNSLKTGIKILKIVSYSKLLKTSQEIKVVPAYSEKKQIAEIKLTALSEGNFVSTIEITTNDKSYFIECVASMIFSLIELSTYHLSFNPDTSITYNMNIFTNIQHHMYIDKVTSSSLSLSTLGLIKIPADEQGGFKLTINSKARTIQFLKIYTTMCTLQVPIVIEDPVLFFSYLKNGEYQTLNGPIDLGYLAYDSPVTVSLIIKNPNKFEITIDLIESIPQSKIEMPKRNTISPLSSIECSVNLRADRPLFNPVIFHTSIGSFFISISLNVVAGIAKIKSIYFNEVIPGVLKEQFLYFTNNFPVSVKILYISSPVSFLSFESTRDIVLPAKEVVIGKVKLLYGKNEKIQLDWNKFLTYGDARA